MTTPVQAGSHRPRSRCSPPERVAGWAGAGPSPEDRRRCTRWPSSRRLPRSSPSCVSRPWTVTPRPISPPRSPSCSTASPWLAVPSSEASRNHVKVTPSWRAPADSGARGSQHERVEPVTDRGVACAASASFHGAVDPSPAWTRPTAHRPRTTIEHRADHSQHRHPHRQARHGGHAQGRRHHGCRHT